MPHVLGVSEAQVRCVCEDMGGNFGTRNFFYPEYALLPWAARQYRPAGQMDMRAGKSFLSDYQGRDLTVKPNWRSTTAENSLRCAARI